MRPAEISNQKSMGSRVQSPRVQCPKFANWPPKHRNINNEMFYGRGNSCFRTRPITRCGQQKDRIQNPWAQRYTVQGSKCPKFANWPPKHRNINNERFFSRGNSCFRTRPQNTMRPAEKPNPKSMGSNVQRSNGPKSTCPRAKVSKVQSPSGHLNTWELSPSGHQALAHSDTWTLRHLDA
jgi:hypothetical protein